VVEIHRQNKGGSLQNMGGGAANAGAVLAAVRASSKVVIQTVTKSKHKKNREDRSQPHVQGMQVSIVRIESEIIRAALMVPFLQVIPAVAYLDSLSCFVKQNQVLDGGYYGTAMQMPSCYIGSQMC